MVIALIILSLIAITAIALVILFGKAMLNLYDYATNLEFLCSGLEEIPEELIQEIYPNTTLLFHLEISDNDNLVQAYDTSLYLKNHIIGLTLFAQEQMLERIAQKRNMTAEDLIDYVQDTIFPSCTVYKLKDGQWTWRKEE